AREEPVAARQTGPPPAGMTSRSGSRTRWRRETVSSTGDCTGAWLVGIGSHILYSSKVGNVSLVGRSTGNIRHHAEAVRYADQARWIRHPRAAGTLAAGARRRTSSTTA